MWENGVFALCVVNELYVVNNCDLVIYRKKGLVINIASLSAEFPLAMLTVYSASKV